MPESLRKPPPTPAQLKRINSLLRPKRRVIRKAHPFERRLFGDYWLGAVGRDAVIQRNVDPWEMHAQLKGR
jgi:hypothetical protein